ncbi:hypothetical protein [Streptomyces ochraceiscleroticus]|uniref:Integral membrane protein n=1 Tax=Streptomyces ochraceiscleroticus TaxID=47761 RepID=A0ABW1MH96_9ACTN
MAARRPVAVVTAVVLVLEAAGIVLLNWILSVFVDKQRMSMAGLETHAMSAGAWIGGLVFGLYLLFCAYLALRCAVRDRAPGGFARIVLISCAVIHGVVGAFTVGLVGWAAFAGAMVTLGLLIFTLLAYGEPRTAPQPAEPDAPGTPDAPDAPGAEPSPAA